MVNFMMAVNRYCADCMKQGEFLPLHFVMMNIHSGMWMCPKTECVFPMNSHLMKDYIEEDMTTDKVLQLTKMGRRRGKVDKKNVGEVTKDNLLTLHTSLTQDTTPPSDEGSVNTTISKYSKSTTTTTSGASTISSSTSNRKTLHYPLWENTSLLCWLDAALAMLVLNTSMLEILSDEGDCLIAHLFTEYKKVLISYNTFFDYKAVQKQLDYLRTNILKFLQPKLFANYGEEDSPLVCLPLVLRTSKNLSEALETSYRCEFECTSCGFKRNDGFKKIVMTLPNTSEDLNFNNNIYFSRGCYKCFTDHQHTRYVIEKYPSVMFVHFPQGVQSKRCWVDFNFVTPDGEHYMVTQIVQYHNHKRHFVLWSFSYQEKLWLEADDLKEPVSQHKHKRPRCRPHEVHIVIWERLSSLRSNTLANKYKTDALNSPSNSLFVDKGSSPSISWSTSLLTPDELPAAGNSQNCSRGSSKRSSVCSSDGILPSSSSQSKTSSSQLSNNPFRSPRTILQKGLRNTPRYEPYVPRSARKTKAEALANEGVKKSTHATTINGENLSTKSDNKCDDSLTTTTNSEKCGDSHTTTDSDVKCGDSQITHGVEKCGDNFSTNSDNTSCKSYEPNKNSPDDTVSLDFLKGVLPEGRNKNSPEHKVSLDFLKGVLSEGLSDDLLLCSSDSNTQLETDDYNTEKAAFSMTPTKTQLDLDALAEQSLKDLYNLLSD